MPIQTDVSFIRTLHLRALRLSYFLSIGMGGVGGSLIGSLALDLAKRPDSPSVLSLGLLGTLSLALFLLPVCLVHGLSAPLRRALRMTAGLSLHFTADDLGLHIPALLLTDPAFSHLVDENRATLFIPWKDIAAWEVREARGNAGPRHHLQVSGSTERYGRRSDGGPAWKETGFALARAPLAKIETELLARVREQVAGGVQEEAKGWFRSTG